MGFDFFVWVTGTRNTRFIFVDKASRIGHTRDGTAGIRGRREMENGTVPWVYIYVYICTYIYIPIVPLGMDFLLDSINSFISF